MMDEYVAMVVAVLVITILVTAGIAAIAYWLTELIFRQ